MQLSNARVHEKEKKKKEKKKTSDFWHFFCFPIVLYLVLWNITQVLIPCSPPNYHLNNIKTRQPVIHLHYAKSHYLSQRLHVKCSCLRKNLSDLLTSCLHRKRDYVNKTKPDTVVCMQEKHVVWSSKLKWLLKKELLMFPKHNSSMNQKHVAMLRKRPRYDSLDKNQTITFKTIFLQLDWQSARFT